MQVLREALLQELPAQIMQFTVIRNKILCLTQNQLILLCIDAICKKSQIPYNGSNIYKMQISKDYVALLQRSGKLQIRRIDNLGEVICIDKNIKIINNQYPRLKWWEDDLHLVYQNYFITLNVFACKNSKKGITCQNYQKVTVETQSKKQLLDLCFCDLFNETRSLFYVFEKQVIMTVNKINIASISVEQNQEIRQALKLCRPFQQNEYNKQYLVLLVQRVNDKKNHIYNRSIQKNKSETFNQQQSIYKQKQIVLKVYNILTLEKIFEKSLIDGKSHEINEIQMATDDLSEYLLIKHYKKAKQIKLNHFHNKEIQYQQLLKVNSQYYFSQQINYQEHDEPFFMFDIQIGLKKNLKLFPSHQEEISGKMCDSIDTCYFQKNQVHIASIVLQTGYKNDIYHNRKNINIVTNFNPKNQGITGKNDDNLQQQLEYNQLIIWRQLVQAKVNPKKFIKKLINVSEINKYHPNFNLKKQKPQNNHKHNHNKLQTHNNISNTIAFEHQNILHSLLNKLHKINNFSLINQKINAYQTMKQILAIQYFPMLLDVMAIQKDQMKKEKENMQKSHQDASKTMSGFSSSTPPSPRSENSTIKPIIDKKDTQKEILNENDTVNPQKTSYENIDRPQNQQAECFECYQLQDHQNLQLTLSIVSQNSKKSEKTLQQIEESIYRMQTLTKYRLQKIEMKTRKDKKESNKIVSWIEDEFHESLKILSHDLLNSAEKFTEKISFLPEKSINKIKEKQEQFIEIIEQKTLLCQNSAKIHKENHQQLLDYLYDIEFPQIGFQNQPKAQNMLDFFNINDLSKSLFSKSNCLDKTVNQLNMSKQKNQEQFRLFSQFVLKNFI